MRQPLTRIAGPLLAAGALVLGSTALANADIPETHYYCNGPITVAPQITETTCVWVEVYSDITAEAYMTVNNGSPYTLTLGIDLLVGSATYPGGYSTLGPGKNTNVSTNAVQNPNGPLTGRGYIAGGGWSTYTYNH